MTNPIVPSISDEQLEALEQFCRIPAFNENANVFQNIGELRGIIGRLRAAEADAKRYQWLRDQFWVEQEATFRLDLSRSDDFSRYQKEISSAIDAAMENMNEQLCLRSRN